MDVSLLNEVIVVSASSGLGRIGFGGLGHGRDGGGCGGCILSILLSLHSFSNYIYSFFFLLHY